MTLPSDILSKAAPLTASKPGHSNVHSVLLSRLADFYTAHSLPIDHDITVHSSLEQVQLQTAKASISVVENVQSLLSGSSSTDDVPLLGSRDLSQLHTLISIVFQWGTRPLVMAQHDTAANAFLDLSSFATRILALIFPSGVQGGVAQTLITTSLLQKYAKDVLLATISVGWAPKSSAANEIRPLISRMLRLYVSDCSVDLTQVETE